MQHSLGVTLKDREKRCVDFLDAHSSTASIGIIITIISSVAT